MGSNHEKIEGRKSRDTLPLRLLASKVSEDIFEFTEVLRNYYVSI